MQFKKEVQDLFKQAGWFSSRNVRSQFDALPYFHYFPMFLREFLYEYGDLVSETHKYKSNDTTGIMDFKIVRAEEDTISYYLNEPRYYGEIMTFPIADYDLDNAILQCDSQGKVYMVGDFAILMSNDFKTGIEKAMMEDYSDTLVWDTDTNMWEHIDAWNKKWGL